jgi:hypothetical protein
MPVGLIIKKPSKKQLPTQTFLKCAQMQLALSINKRKNYTSLAGVPVKATGAH